MRANPPWFGHSALARESSAAWLSLYPREIQHARLRYPGFAEDLVHRFDHVSIEPGVLRFAAVFFLTGF